MVSLTETKRQVAGTLVTAELKQREQLTRESPLNVIKEAHVFSENRKKRGLQCALCKFLFQDNKEGKSIYEYTICKRIFHISFFSAQHNLYRTRLENRGYIMQYLRRMRHGTVVLYGEELSIWPQCWRSPRSYTSRKISIVQEK